MPRLPRKKKVDVDVAKPRRMSPRRATNGPRAPSEPPDLAQCHKLPRETKVNVAKRHACHVKGRWVSPSATRHAKFRGVTGD